MGWSRREIDFCSDSCFLALIRVVPLSFVSSHFHLSLLCSLPDSALALVQEESAQTDAAGATVAKAAKLVTPARSLAFKERVLRYQIHLARANRKACDAFVAEQEKTEWFAGARALAALQVARSALMAAVPAPAPAEQARGVCVFERMPGRINAAATINSGVFFKSLGHCVEYLRHASS